MDGRGYREARKKSGVGWGAQASRRRKKRKGGNDFDDDDDDVLVLKVALSSNLKLAEPADWCHSFAFVASIGGCQS